MLQTGYLWGILGDAVVGTNLFLMVAKRLSARRIRKLNKIMFTSVAVIAILNGLIPLWVSSTVDRGLIYTPSVGW